MQPKRNDEKRWMPSHGRKQVVKAKVAVARRIRCLLRPMQQLKKTVVDAVRTEGTSRRDVGFWGFRGSSSRTLSHRCFVAKCSQVGDHRRNTGLGPYGKRWPGGHRGPRSLDPCQNTGAGLYPCRQDVEPSGYGPCLSPKLRPPIPLFSTGGEIQVPLSGAWAGTSRSLPDSKPQLERYVTSRETLERQGALLPSQAAATNLVVTGEPPGDFDVNRGALRPRSTNGTGAWGSGYRALQPQFTGAWCSQKRPWQARRTGHTGALRSDWP